MLLKLTADSFLAISTLRKTVYFPWSLPSHTEHLIPKWPPFYCSFVYLQISHCCLVLKLEYSKEYFPLNEATRANLQGNKRILKYWPFWNKVYCDHYIVPKVSHAGFLVKWVSSHPVSAIL